MCMFINKSLSVYTNILFHINSNASIQRLTNNAKYTKTMRSDKQTNVYGTKIE